jgi:hypothetical protein
VLSGDANRRGSAVRFRSAAAWIQRKSPASVHLPGFLCSAGEQAMQFHLLPLQSFLSADLISSIHRNAGQFSFFRVYFHPNTIEPADLLVNARSGYPIRYIFCIATW